MFRFIAAVVGGLLLTATSAQSSGVFNPARPPAIPLAVKSPYLSTWLHAGSDGGNGGYLAGEWPVHWTDIITGWAGMIKVDGTNYAWMGIPQGPSQNVNQTSFSYTSTRSTFIMDVGGVVQMNITFLSPITPNDLQRQSLPFSYVDVAVSSTDGNSHNVQLYADISAEWCAGERNPSPTAAWNYGTIGNVAYHQVYRQEQIVFSESNEPTSAGGATGNGMADWGNVFWATDAVQGLTWQSGQDIIVRGNFVSNGTLPNTADPNFRPIQQDWPVFGFAKSLGSVGATPVTTLFTIGLIQQQAVQFVGDNGLVTLNSLWTSYWPNDTQAMQYFHNDYSNMNSMSTSLDDQIASDSTAAAGQDYLTITSLALRQAFGALELVGDPSNMYIFMKEISSNGDTQTVDVVYPLHPALLYTNPTLLQLVLKPLYENQESGHYPNTYAMHDLGQFPNATGYPAGNDEEMPVEECGNMIIMTLAYAQRAKDTAFLSQHYAKMQQWVGYLIDDSLIPANQLSTDDFAGTLANQTNLALKGIIGIGAMAQIAQLTGNTADAQNYSNIAQSYISQWQNFGIAQAQNGTLAHTTLNYGANDTHGLLYNLWADQELGLNLVPKSVYSMQSDFYPTVEEPFGVPLDTRHTYTKGDWEVMTAATCEASTRDMFLSKLANWINVTPTNRALTDLYDTITGDYPDIFFVARPVMGATFSLLVSENNNSTSTGGSSSRRSISQRSMPQVKPKIPRNDAHMRIGI